jgi:hypothetical protein
MMGRSETAHCSLVPISAVERGAKAGCNRSTLDGVPFAAFDQRKSFPPFRGLRLGEWANGVLGAGPGILKYDMGLLPFLQGKVVSRDFQK